MSFVAIRIISVRGPQTLLLTATPQAHAQQSQLTPSVTESQLSSVVWHTALMQAFSSQDIGQVTAASALSAIAFASWPAMGVRGRRAEGEWGACTDYCCAVLHDFQIPHSSQHSAQQPQSQKAVCFSKQPPHWSLTVCTWYRTVVVVTCIVHSKFKCHNDVFT